MVSKKKLHYDVFVGMFLMIFGAFIIYKALQMPIIPRRFSLLASGMFFLFAVVIFIQGIKKTLDPDIPYEEIIKWKEVKYAMGFFAITLSYVILMDLLSFFVATTLYCPIIMYFMGIRSKKMLILNTLFTDVFVWVVFAKLLEVNLP